MRELCFKCINVCKKTVRNLLSQPDRCDISLSGNVYQITEHKSLHGNVGITSPKRGKNAYVCVCVCVFCACVCVPQM